MYVGVRCLAGSEISAVASLSSVTSSDGERSACSSRCDLSFEIEGLAAVVLPRSVEALVSGCCDF